MKNVVQLIIGRVFIGNVVRMIRAASDGIYDCVFEDKAAKDKCF
jgi:hypothetical protein